MDTHIETPHTTEAMIVVNGLHKTYGATLAVDNLSLQVQPGEIYGLVGSDGAGKTTTFRVIVGAIKPTTGDVSVAGYSVRHDIEQVRSRIGYLSQRFSLYEDLTVWENICFFAELHGIKKERWQPRCREVLDFVGLTSFFERKAGALSGGMRQKLGLATALVTQPSVLILDEPTTGVDPVTRQDFWKLIIQLVNHPENGDPVTVLVSTPYMDEAARCHRIGFMRKGVLIAEGAPGQLRAGLNNRIVALRGAPLNSLRQAATQMKGVQSVSIFGDHLHLQVETGQAEPVIASLRQFAQESGVKLDDARVIPPVLEDVFISLSEQFAQS